jgi:DNA-binding NarL/FixJ family response regulator
VSTRQDWLRNESLTDREVAVLIRIADGLRYTEIADEMVISVHTVKSHALAIYSKLGAQTAAHAVALAYHRGILVPSAPHVGGAA